MCVTHDPVLESLRETVYEEFGRDARVWDADRIALFQDHLVPVKDAVSRRRCVAMDRFAVEQGISKYYPYGADYGVCHIVMCERGRARPGEIVIGTDSHKVAPGVQLVIVRATMGICRVMTETGVLDTLLEAVAVVESLGCKACFGAHGGIPGDGEVCLATTNRNFKGRMGNPSALVYLSSPYVAGKTALAGCLTNERGSRRWAATVAFWSCRVRASARR